MPWRILLLAVALGVSACESNPQSDDADVMHADEPVPTESVDAYPGDPVALSNRVAGAASWHADSGSVVEVRSGSWYVPPFEDGTYRVAASVADRDVLGLDVTVTGIKPATLSDVVSDGQGGLSGRYGSVTFVARRTSDGFGEATFSSGEQEVVSTVTGYESGSVSWSGQALDGVGSLTETERETLRRLADSDLAPALTFVSLELACRNEAERVDPVVGAALVLPWQVLLKYLAPYPVALARHYATMTSCRYFPTNAEAADTSMTVKSPSPNVMILGDESPLPAVLFHFPLDAAGAAEPVSDR